MVSRSLRGSIFMLLTLMTGPPVAASQDTPRAQDSLFKAAIPFADLVLGRRQQAEYHSSAIQDEGGGEPPAQESRDEEQLEGRSFMDLLDADRDMLRAHREEYRVEGMLSDSSKRCPEQELCLLACWACPVLSFSWQCWAWLP